MKNRILLLGIFLSRILHAEDEVDLSDLGMSDFTPYVVDRNWIWILLPIGILLMVLLHLKQPPKPKNTQGDAP